MTAVYINNRAFVDITYMQDFTPAQKLDLKPIIDFAEKLKPGEEKSMLVDLIDLKSTLNMARGGDLPDEQIDKELELVDKLIYLIKHSFKIR